MRELIELQRTLFTFLHVMATHDLSSVFLVKSMTYIEPMTLLLLNASCTHKDITVRKVCNTCPFGYTFLVHLLIALFLYWLPLNRHACRYSLDLLKIGVPSNTPWRRSALLNLLVHFLLFMEEEAQMP